MIELWETGYTSNRTHQITASFLSKYLNIPWQYGHSRVHNTLFDADKANNSACWQWVAGSELDAAKRLRIFDPVSQSKKYDPTGYYIRKFLPQLKYLDNSIIHTSWQVEK